MFLRAFRNCAHTSCILLGCDVFLASRLDRTQAVVEVEHSWCKLVLVLVENIVDFVVCKIVAEHKVAVECKIVAEHKVVAECMVVAGRKVVVGCKVVAVQELVKSEALQIADLRAHRTDNHLLGQKLVESSVRRKLYHSFFQ
jgi:hypothetical protein